MTHNPNPLAARLLDMVRHMEDAKAEDLKVIEDAIAAILEARALTEAVLIFHGPQGGYGSARNREWHAIMGTGEQTVKVLVDRARKTLKTFD